MVHWMGIEPAPPAPFSSVLGNQDILTVTHQVGPGKPNQAADVFLVASLLALVQHGMHPAGVGLPTPTYNFDSHLGFWIFFVQAGWRQMGLTQAEADGIVSPVRATRAQSCGEYAYAPGKPYFIVLLNLQAKRFHGNQFAALINEHYSTLGDAVMY